MHDLQALVVGIAITTEQIEKVLDKMTNGRGSRRAFAQIAELAAINADLSEQLRALCAGVDPAQVHRAPAITQ